MKLAGDPCVHGVGSVVDNAPGVLDREAVDRVLAARIAQRELILLAVPGESAIANAIGKRKQDRNAAARGPIVREKLRIAIEQLVPAGLPAIRMETELWPNLQAIVRIAQHGDTAIEAERICALFPF